MKGRTNLVVAVLLLVAFALGVLVGSRRSPKPRVTAPLPNPSATPLEGPESPCVDFRQAALLVGKNGCVSGRVLRTFTSLNGNTFLDFCEDFRDCPFTSVIFVTDANKFGDLQSLRGKHVELRGVITLYRSRPEIVVRDPEQIRSAP